MVCLKPGNVEMQPGRRVSQLLNIAFDMAAWVSLLLFPHDTFWAHQRWISQEILGSMANGCTLCIRGNRSKDWRAVLQKVDIVIGKFVSRTQALSVYLQSFVSYSEHYRYVVSFSIPHAFLTDCIARHDPADYPNIKVLATAGEPCPQRE